MKVQSKIQLYVLLFFHKLRNNRIYFILKIVNDRWGGDASCKHGGFYTCHDRYNPGYLLPHKWENCFTVC